MKKTLEQIETERMNRRQALGRIGFLAGMSAVAAMTSDELLRRVGHEIQKRSSDGQIINAVAKEFQSAGVVLADTPHKTRINGVTSPCDTPDLRVPMNQTEFCTYLNDCYRCWCKDKDANGGIGCDKLCDNIQDCYTVLNTCVSHLVTTYPQYSTQPCMTIPCDDCT
ncbi:MAG: hypothetical protein QM758_21260 [Armatimonas sp.]